VITGSFAVLSFVVYNSEDTSLGIYFGFVAVISLIFYPFYLRWKYKKHFLNHIRENLKSNIGKTASIVINEDHILTFDEDESESRINVKMIKSIHDLPQHYLIKLDGGKALILPKNKVNEPKQLQQDLIELAKSLSLSVEDNTKWDWNKSW